MIGTVGLHRILGSQHHEGTGQRTGLTVQTDLIFLHDLQQTGLHLRGGTVDLIRQKKIAHRCTGTVFQLSGLLIHHRKAHHIRGHNIRRQLNPVEAPSQGTGQGCCQLGLANPGHILDQYMTITEQCSHYPGNHRALSYDDLLHTVKQCLNLIIHNFPFCQQHLCNAAYSIYVYSL